MDRRAFLATGVAASQLNSTLNAADWKPVVPAAELPVAKKGKGKPRLGTQHISDDPTLKILSGLGVNNICSGLPSRQMDANWSVDGLSKLRERVEAHGIRLEMVPLPLSSSPIAKAEYPDILMGRSPQRDKAIDEICQMIRNCAKAGIPAVKYNMSILGVVRTPPAKGRGGATLSTFKYAGAPQDPPLTEAGPVPRICIGSASRTFSTRSFRLLTKKRSEWPVIPMTQACLPAKDGAA